MKSAIFAAFLWASSTLWVSISAGPEEQIARTLRTWSIAALLICLAMRILSRDDEGLGEPWARQVKSALLAFTLFCLCSFLWVGTVHVIAGSQLAGDVATFGSLLIPSLALMAVLALEFTSLRPHAITAGVVFATATITFGFVDFLITEKPEQPGLIRTHQPTGNEEWLHRSIIGTRL